MLNEQYINEIVEKVVKNVMGTSSNTITEGKKGVFDSMTEALAAVEKAYKQFRS